MASILRLVILILLTTLIECSEEAMQKRVKAKKCDLNRNQYFHTQMGRCKRCDKCPEGYGMESEPTFEIHPVYGALGCRKCNQCIPGETYRNKASYKQCKSCRNCTAYGQSEIKACTTSTNTKCRLMSKEVQNEIKEGEQKVANNYEVNEETRKGSEGLKHYAGLFVALAVMISTILCIWWEYRRNHLQMTCRQRRIKTGVPMLVIKEPDEQKIHQTASSDDMPKDQPLTTDGPGADNSAKVVEDELPEKECMLIAKQWAKEHQYRSYAPLLGITRSEVEILEDENPNNEEQVSYLTLDKWKKKNGRNATKSVLRKVLKEFQNPPDLKTLLNTQ